MEDLSDKTAREKRFVDLLENNRRLINKVCYMYAEDTDHFNDLCQEVAANLWLGMPNFRAEAKESTWVYRIAFNTCVTFYRRSSRRPDTTSLDGIAVAVDDSDAERLSRLRFLYRLISGLGKVDRAIVMLWLDEKSYDEIAEITGLTRTNVAARLHRARLKMTKQAEEYETI